MRGREKRPRRVFEANAEGKEEAEEKEEGSG